MLIDKNNKPLLLNLGYLLVGLSLYLSMYFLHGWVTAAIIVAGAIFMALNFNPELLIFLLILSVPFEIPQDIIGSFTIYTTEAILLMGIAAWLVNSRKLTLPEKKLVISSCLFLAGLALSFLVTRNFEVSIKQTVRWLEVFVVYMLVINFFKEMKTITRILNFLLATVLLISVIALVQFAVSGFDFRAVTGTFGHHSPLSGYIGLMLPFALVMFIRENNIGRKSVYGAVFFILLTAMVAGFSRGGWAGFLMACIYIYFSCQAEFRKQLAVIIAVIVILTAGGLLIMPRVFEQAGFASIQKSKRLLDISDDPSVKLRISFWKSAMECIRDNALFGVGIGNYRYVYEKYGMTRLSYGEIWRGDRIVTCKTINPNSIVKVALDYKVVGGNIALDFLELMKFDKNKNIAFVTFVPNVISLVPCDGWRHIEGTFNIVSAKELKDVDLRWAHNNSYAMIFKNIRIYNSLSGEPDSFIPVAYDYAVEHLHNLYLQLWVETGTAGLMAFIWFIITHLFYLLKAAKNKNQNNMLIIGCSAGIIAFLIHNSFDILFVHSIGIVFSILLGIAVVSAASATEK